MPRSMLTGAAAALLVLAPWASVLAQVHTVTASQDTYITTHPVLGGPGSTHGSDPTLYEIGATSCVEGSCLAFSLVQFDLRGFAGQTVVSAASLRLNVVATFSSTTVSQTIEALQVLVPWNESTVSWNSFGPGPICGTNVNCTSLDTVSVTVKPGSSITFSLPAALLQKWIDSPSSNHGLLLLSTTLTTDQDIQFASTRSTVAAGPTLSFQASPRLCTLSDTPSYNSTTSTLTMKFTVGNNLGTTAIWNAWLTYADPQGTDPDTMQLLFSTLQPITNPPKAVTKTFSLPKEGTVGVLSTLSTNKNGIACSSWVQVKTGADPLSP